ncbi:MAG TPA: hypothetical protein PKO18_06915 [Chitinophagales bacterium]|nr:hypothetical protein [Chitinophagales bacterium]HNL84951.1 hypothetical protein [Chitinophagales bacterium]
MLWQAYCDGYANHCGKQFADWSAAYRRFSQNRISNATLFQTVINKVVEKQSNSDYVVADMNDTLIRKRGKKIPGTGWKRDPLGSAFHANFVWGQGFLQISLCLSKLDKIWNYNSDKCFYFFINQQQQA